MTTQIHPIRPTTSVVDRGFLRDVLAGLQQREKRLPCKYFYDARGSALFDRICELPEYYPTRTELAILQANAEAMTARFATDSAFIEYGSGSSLKTRVLLRQLRGGVYHPVDISREHLLTSARRLAEEFPAVQVVSVCADFTKPFTLPPSRSVSRRVVYFSGSTIGNFPPAEAVRLLRQIAALIGPGGGLLIGVDLQKARSILEPAYNDAAGVTAEFNLNLLERINRELGGTFAVERFRHEAIYNEEHGRIEMYLISEEDQEVEIGETCIRFEAGERICTEYSYKYTPAGFAERLGAAGMQVREVWCDPRQLFSVQYAEVVR